MKKITHWARAVKTERFIVCGAPSGYLAKSPAEVTCKRCIRRLDSSERARAIAEKLTERFEKEGEF